MTAHQPQEGPDNETPHPPQSPMTINACVPRQDQDTITTMQAELKQDTIVSPMTVTVCAPGRSSGINMLQDIHLHHPDILHHPLKSQDTRVNDDSQSGRTLTGAVRKSKRKHTGSPSSYHLGVFYPVVGKDGKGGEEGD